MLIDIYAGPIYFRAFSQHAPMDEKFVKCLADHALETITKLDPTNSGETATDTPKAEYKVVTSNYGAVKQIRTSL